MIILNKIYFDNRAVLFGLPQKNAPKKQEEAPQAPAEIPQAPEQTPPAPTKSKKATPKKRRKNPGKLLRRATRKIILLDKDYSLPF